jgi:hypothetical protein
MMTVSSPAILEQLPEAQRAMVEATPAWAIGANAIAVFAGVLGSLFLILKKNLAGPMLMISLAGILVQDFHSFAMAGAQEFTGIGGMLLTAAVLIFAIYLVMLARKAKASGWTS